MTWYTRDADGNAFISDSAPGDFDMDRRVALTEDLPGGVRVSTVFLALDHSFGDGPPVLWETMVFPADSYMDLECERYTSQADALAGHERMVDRAQAGEWADR
jgi:hypothetical protein